MITDLEIYHSASVLIRHHGDDAAIHAAQMIDEMLDRGDMDGRETWKRIAAAVDRLMVDGPAAGDAATAAIANTIATAPTAATATAYFRKAIICTLTSSCE